MSEYQYYEFLAVDRPLTAAEQAEVRQLSTRARITATSFTNEYHWGNFRGDPRVMMRRYYDAHLYLANWGTHQIMLRLPRTLLSPKIAEQYGVDGHVGVTAAPESVIPDLISEDDSGEWVEGAEDSLSAIVGVRSELAAGDLRALYLAWLSAYGGWEWDEDAFGEDDEDEREPPVRARVADRPRSALWPISSASILICSRWRRRPARSCRRRRRIRACWPPTSPGCPAGNRRGKGQAPHAGRAGSGGTGQDGAAARLAGRSG